MKISLILEMLRKRVFRLLWIGQGATQLGSAFDIITLPWLVLKLTGDAFAMGTVLAVWGIPRALFILIGGALVDRSSPRFVMIIADSIRLFLVLLMSILVLTQVVELWMIYVFAFCVGLTSAFVIPARSAIVPFIVESELIQSANSVIMGTSSVCQLIGPALAGITISYFGNSITQTSNQSAVLPDAQGLGFSFIIQGIMILISVITLWMMKFKIVRGNSEEDKNVWSSIKAGFVTMWRDVTLRAWFFIIIALCLLFTGPLIIGVPFLADTRFSQGSTAFGIIMSALGGGGLLGALLAGVIPRPGPRWLGSILALLICMHGVGLILLYNVYSTSMAAIIALMMGTIDAYAYISFHSWVQRRTPKEMMGRIMSLLSLANFGVQPISQVIAGAVVAINTKLLFVGSGSLLIVIMIIFALTPVVRAMGTERETID